MVTNHIYRTYPDLSEGELAKLRAAVVSSVSLAAAARALDLGSMLRLGKGELASGGADKSSILADAAEAVIGAVYLDGGWEPAERVVLDLFSEPIGESARMPGVEDFKTRLQELAARHCENLPRYSVVGDGPDHEKHFHAVVHIDAEVFGEGDGRSKKESEQAAAAVAWEKLHAAVQAAGASDEQTLGNQE